MRAIISRKGAKSQRITREEIIFYEDSKIIINEEIFCSIKCHFDNIDKILKIKEDEEFEKYLKNTTNYEQYI